MRKFYTEFFLIPKNGKISDKVMLTRLTFSVCVIVVCLFAMSISAYAYFSHSFTSAPNTIASANFAINVSVENLDDDTDTVEVIQTSAMTHSADLKAGRTYRITIEKNGEASGFCTVSAKNCKIPKYFTEQMDSDSITFTLTLTSDATVEFSANWGTSIYYLDYVEDGTDTPLYIRDGETVNLQLNDENP